MPSAKPKQPTFNVAFAGPGMISHFHMIAGASPAIVHGRSRSAIP